MPGIVGGVFQHALRKGALGPIGPLVCLGEPDTEVALQERRQADGRGTQEGGGGLGVEEAPQSNAEVPIQQADVVVGAMHDDLDLRVFQDRAEKGRGVQSQGIQDDIVSGNGDLNQAKPV